MLGYLVDHHDAVLRERLRSWRDDREQRADAMAAALRELGYELDESELERRKAEGKPIGRPHLADAVVRHPGNSERLRSEGLDERSAFLEAYLIDGKPAFKPRTKPTVSESIAAIHDAGGVAVWAHPFWDVKDPAEVLETIDRFRDWGLDGVECFYATHTREQAELLADRCAELGLLTTGSSDFHGPAHRLFSRFRAFSTYGREPCARSDRRAHAPTDREAEGLAVRPAANRPTAARPEHARAPAAPPPARSTSSSSGCSHGRSSTSASRGRSYGASTPVKPVIFPTRARAYSPFGSRRSHSVERGVHEHLEELELATLVDAARDLAVDLVRADHADDRDRRPSRRTGWRRAPPGGCSRPGRRARSRDRC